MDQILIVSNSGNEKQKQILIVSNSGNEKQKQPITLLAVLQSPEFLQLPKDCCKELSQTPLCTLNACNKP
jgi:hypothetical protein